MPPVRGDAADPGHSDTAGALAAPAIVPAAAPILPEASPVAAPAATPLASSFSPSLPPLPSAEPAPVPSIALPPGHYSHRVRWHLRPDVLEWITPGCLAGVFFLSFFNWYHRDDGGLNLWELAFSFRGQPVYSFYTVMFVFVAVPLAAVAFGLAKGWIPMHPELRPIWPWRSVIVGGAIALPFVFFLVDYIEFQFLPFGTQASIAMKLAFRLHFLGVVSSVAQLWLDWRKRRNLPFPRIDLRW